MPNKNSAAKSPIPEVSVDIFISSQHVGTSGITQTFHFLTPCKQSVLPSIIKILILTIPDALQHGLFSK